jgi:DNA processing protein
VIDTWPLTVVPAVPGPVTSPMSAGCHRLMRDGLATCVTDAADVAELAMPIGEQLAAIPPVPAADHDGLSPEDVRVLDALPLRSAVGIDALARAAGLEPTTVAAGLGRLEVAGLARREGAGWRRHARGTARRGHG